jgi:hypothetical protein
MVDKVFCNLIIERLIEYIRDECGITTHEDDYDIEENGGNTIVFYFGRKLGSWLPVGEGGEPDPSYPADVAILVMESAGDVRERLTDIQIERIVEHLHDIEDKIKEILTKEGLSKSITDTLELEVESSSAPDDGSGFLPLQLSVTCGPDVKLKVEINPFSPEEPVDPLEVASDIISELE